MEIIFFAAISLTHNFTSCIGAFLNNFYRKQCILAESRFDFLKDLVMAVPDVQGEGEEGGSGTVSVPGTPTGLVHHQQHPPVFIRSQSEASTLTGTTAGSSSSTAPRRVVGGTGRPRGRPRKNPVVTFQNPAATRLIGINSFYKVYFYVSKSI